MNFFPSIKRPGLCTNLMSTLEIIKMDHKSSQFLHFYPCLLDKGKRKFCLSRCKAQTCLLVKGTYQVQTNLLV